MSYLYIICNQFYEEMKRLTKVDDDVVNKQFKFSYDNINQKISELFIKVLINKKSFYAFLLEIINCYKFIDVDLVCDCLLECEVESIPLIKGDDQLLKSIKNYQNLENENLKYTISKLIISFECLRMFINIVRHKYLPDFFEKDHSKQKIQDFFRELIYSKRINDIKICKRDCSDENSIFDLISESKKCKMDYISFFVDSRECSDLILEQQKYYVSELERLLDKIGELGNCTGLDYNKYEVFLNFIYYMKDYAIKKIKSIIEVDKSFVIK